MRVGGDRRGGLLACLCGDIGAVENPVLVVDEELADLLSMLDGLILEVTHPRSQIYTRLGKAVEKMGDRIYIPLERSKVDAVETQRRMHCQHVVAGGELRF